MSSGSEEGTPGRQGQGKGLGVCTGSRVFQDRVEGQQDKGGLQWLAEGGKKVGQTPAWGSCPPLREELGAATGGGRRDLAPPSCVRMGKTEAHPRSKRGRVTAPGLSLPHAQPHTLPHTQPHTPSWDLRLMPSTKSPPPPPPQKKKKNF